MARQRLDDRDPAAATREHDPQDPLGRAGLLEQRVDLGAQRVEVDSQAQAGAGAREPGEVVLERERAPGVQAQHLEGAVAAQQSFVRDRDPRLAGGPDGAVDAREHGVRVRRGGR